MSVKILTEQESEMFLHGISDFNRYNRPLFSAHRNHLLSLLMLDAGLRVKEAVTLRWAQLVYIDLPNTTVQINALQSHAKMSRCIPISQRLHQAIKNFYQTRHLIDHPEPLTYVFFGRSPEGHMTTRQAYRIINQAGKASLGRAVHPHMLRHTFATRVMRTSPTRVVQELLGHKSLTSTQVYTHPNTEDLTKAINNMHKPV